MSLSNSKDVVANSFSTKTASLPSSKISAGPSMLVATIGFFLLWRKTSFSDRACATMNGNRKRRANQNMAQDYRKNRQADTKTQEHSQKCDSHNHFGQHQRQHDQPHQRRFERKAVARRSAGGKNTQHGRNDRRGHSDY